MLNVMVIFFTLFFIVISFKIFYDIREKRKNTLQKMSHDIFLIGETETEIIKKDMLKEKILRIINNKE